VPPTVRIGAKLAQYEITQHLGSGGMGDVYQATDSTLGRNVQNSPTLTQTLGTQAGVILGTAAYKRPTIPTGAPVMMPDGKRFIVVMPEANASAQQTHVNFLLNFPDELDRRVSAGTSK
jgi:serine/threonine protein kinase